VKDVRENREALRRRLRAERSALSPAELHSASQACATNFAPLIHGVVALYSPIRGEIDPCLWPGFIINDAVWPRVEDDGRLTFRSGPLAPGRYEIPAPAADAPEKTPDVILVPGLAFDRRGHRLGYGRGYYDRALAACPRALRIGLCHSFQLVEVLPEEAHDQPVDYIVTPDGALATNARLKETP
jgi:5-formyltetrahydrofolate cyclo-ligase